MPDSLELLSTGDPNLDTILGGGFPVRSVTVIAGHPGSGKTLLTLQLLFHLARQGRKCLFVTTLSEPAMKLVRYLQAFPFFDERLLERTVVFFDLGSSLRTRGIKPALDELAERVEREEPAVVVIDSFKAIGDFDTGSLSARTLVYDLAVHMAAWGATTFLVGEYTQPEMGCLPEFAVADGIIRLANVRRELTTEREIEVLKLRGAHYVPGVHFFVIDPGGITFYPRVRAPDLDGRTAGEAPGSVETGIPGLDALMGGGLPRSSATVVEGATGTGKTLFGLRFLVEGARRGERGILFTLDESPGQLRGLARGLGMDLAELEDPRRLVLSYTSPVELSTDRFLNEARRLVRETGATRAVFDDLTSMALGVPSKRRFKELVYALTRHFRAAGVTLVMTMEIPELLGSAAIGGQGVSFAADNLVRLRYLQLDGRLERALSVIKMRGVKHANTLHLVSIGRDGFEVGAPFSDVHGALPGSASSPGRPGT